MINTVKIIGSGLIGTSIGLALKTNSKAGITQVLMQDTDLKAQKLAQSLVDPAADDSIKSFDLVVVAVPISENITTVSQNLKENPKSIVVDLASVKSNLLNEVEGLSENRQNFVSLHPMAGREVSGAHSARADLFVNRAWIGIAPAYSSAKAKEMATEFVQMCGGTLYWRTIKEHDEIVALVSHVPQILSSAMAIALVDRTAEDLLLSGSGLTDMTRLAASDSQLWTQILQENSSFVNAKLETLIKTLMQFQAALALNKTDEIKKLLETAKIGRQKIPGKHGAKPRNYLNLNIVIKDEPGQLAKIIDLCAKNKINIEDISIEHSPGQATGLVTISILDLADSARSETLNLFKSNGWDIYLDFVKER